MQAPKFYCVPMDDGRPLRRGWTTGACATAACKGAFTALATGEFPDPVEITLPGGQSVGFSLAVNRKEVGSATAGVIKDAGDDPDVTHGALVLATVRNGAADSGVSFKAGPGVGTVTLPGLPVPPGEPAINPVPRKMMRAAIAEVANAYGHPGDVEIEISIPYGEEMAAKTLNARLGIVGGLSILGTTGVVVPYSCAAWIASIQRGIDVARATGLTHVAGATGRTSEAAVKALYDLPETALLDMGDFVGGTLQEFKGTPWQNPQALIEQAPVTYAGNFRTPMLIIHGGNDYRVDPSQGLSMFQVLQAKHVPSKLLYFEAENHWVLKPADSVLWYHTVLGWIDQWVKPDRAEFQRQLTAASSSGTPRMETRTSP